MSSALRAAKGAAGKLVVNETTSSSAEMTFADQWDSVLLLCTTADVRYRLGDVDDDAVQTDIWLKAGIERTVAITGTYLHVIVETDGGSGHDLEYCPVSTRRVLWVHLSM